MLLAPESNIKFFSFTCINSHIILQSPIYECAEKTLHLRRRRWRGHSRVVYQRAVNGLSAGVLILLSSRP